MKIIAYAPVWGRHKAVALFAANCLHNKVQGYVVVSNEEDKAWCEKLHLKTTMYPNKDFGAKLQHGLNWLKEFEWDACIMMGSDDTIDGIDIIRNHLFTYSFIAFGDCHFESLETGEKGYWPGYTNHRKGEPAGAGRIYRRPLLERMNFDLWTEVTHGTTDSQPWQRVQKFTDNILILTSADGVKLTDYKDKDSLTSFQRLKSSINR